MSSAAPSRVRSREVLLVGAFLFGCSVGRASARSARPTAPSVDGDLIVVPPPTAAGPASPAHRSRRRRLVRLALAAFAATSLVGAAVLAVAPGDARAPLVAKRVAAHQHALAAKRAEAERLRLLRHLELAGIAARSVGMPESPALRPVRRPQPAIHPSERAIALDTYIQALGTNTILRGLDASRSQLEQQVLSDPRVQIYPAGRGDVSSGRIDVRVLAMIEYLAQADGEVSVSCLVAGHSLYVHGHPGVVSAHIYGRAVDVSTVGNVPILDHQGLGSVTERAIQQILALPQSVEPLQVISLMSLGGPSFALPDHYNHIHIGY